MASSDQKIKPKLFNLYKKGVIFAAFPQGSSLDSEKANRSDSIFVLGYGINARGPGNVL